MVRNKHQEYMADGKEGNDGLQAMIHVSSFGLQVGLNQRSPSVQLNWFKKQDCTREHCGEVSNGLSRLWYGNIVSSCHVVSNQISLLCIVRMPFSSS